MFKIKLHSILFVLALIGLSKLNFAQSNSATAKLDTTKILIGEQSNIILKAIVGVSDKLTWPLLSDTISSKIDIVNKGKIDTAFTADKKHFTLQQKITITSFDSGYWAIPPFYFILNGDTNNVLSTEALLIEVNTIAVDTAKAFKDIKQPLDAPITFKEILPYIIYGAIGVAIIAGLIYYFKKRKKKIVIVQEIKEPEIPAHVWALAELELLNNEKLWQQGKYKIYHIRLSDILRTYLEKKYAIYAMEHTTDEILTSMRSIDITSEQRAKMRQVLFLSDMVKFAKENPLANENELSYQNVLQFINETSTINQTQYDKLV